MSSYARILVVPFAVAVLVALFAWPSARSEPRDLPLGVAGPAPAADVLEHRLAAEPGAFELHRYTDEAAARAAIEDREVYGAYVATPSGPKVLVASGASPVVAQSLTKAAEAQGARAVEDVVPIGHAGAALGSCVLPLVLAGLLTGLLASLLAPPDGRRAALVAAGAILAGVAATAVVQSWLGVVEGSWAANAAALSLMVLAVASVIAGLHALLGERGVALGAVTMILIGNPFAAVASAPELLPSPVGGLGQLLPPGAGGNLLRSTSFFDGAGAGGHVAVLAAWALAGLGCRLVAMARGRTATAATGQPGRLIDASSAP